MVIADILSQTSAARLFGRAADAKENPPEASGGFSFA
jgi:hypothetical protein